MRLKEKIDNLEAFLSDRISDIEDTLKRIVARGEIVEILRTELELMREERKELLNRLMARNFETLQEYTAGGRFEEEKEEAKPEEDEASAGEIFRVGD